mmetsp:Transcript_2465/g.7813  ORF Transcript_2465/g.7813 Transcript_2465/m.7813 type:complete len:472 (+) Transcript_2465:43-1458(+)
MCKEEKSTERERESEREEEKSRVRTFKRHKRKKKKTHKRTSQQTTQSVPSEGEQTRVTRGERVKERRLLGQAGPDRRRSGRHAEHVVHDHILTGPVVRHAQQIEGTDLFGGKRCWISKLIRMRRHERLGQLGSTGKQKMPTAAASTDRHPLQVLLIGLLVLLLLLLLQGVRRRGKHLASTEGGTECARGGSRRDAAQLVKERLGAVASVGEGGRWQVSTGELVVDGHIHQTRLGHEVRYEAEQGVLDAAGAIVEEVRGERERDAVLALGQHVTGEADHHLLATGMVGVRANRFAELAGRVHTGDRAALDTAQLTGLVAEHHVEELVGEEHHGRRRQSPAAAACRQWHREAQEIGHATLLCASLQKLQLASGHCLALRLRAVRVRSHLHRVLQCVQNQVAVVLGHRGGGARLRGVRCWRRLQMHLCTLHLSNQVAHALTLGAALLLLLLLTVVTMLHLALHAGHAALERGQL